MTITYAGFAVGGTSGVYLLHGRHRLSRSYERSSISFEVTVVETTEALFATACAALETAYRTPRGALRIQLGAVDLLNLTHAGSTGYDAVATSIKGGSVTDNGRSRKYEVSIEFSEPADLSGQSGRRESAVERTFDPSRKATIAISGVYTALGANDAQAQYAAASGAFFTAVLSGFGGTFEKVSERTSRNDSNKELSFTVVFEEVIFNQAVGLLDHPAIVQPQITVEVSVQSPGDSPLGGARRLRTVVAAIDTSVDKTETTDLNGLYEGTIKPHLIAQAVAVSGGGVALVSQNKTLDGTRNRISATLVFLAVSTSTTFEYSLRTRVRDRRGVTLVDVWSDNVLGKRVMRGPGSRIRTITERILEFGGSGVLHTEPGPIDIFALPVGKVLLQSQAGGQGWIMMEGEVEEEVRRLGDTQEFDVTERTVVWTQEWAELPSGGTGDTPSG